MYTQSRQKHQSSLKHRKSMIKVIHNISVLFLYHMSSSWPITDARFNQQTGIWAEGAVRNKTALSHCFWNPIFGVFWKKSYRWKALCYNWKLLGKTIFGGGRGGVFVPKELKRALVDLQTPIERISWSRKPQRVKWRQVFCGHDKLSATQQVSCCFFGKTEDSFFLSIFVCRNSLKEVIRFLWVLL